VKNFTNYFGIGTDAQIAYIAQRLKAKTAALKRVAYGFAGFLSFWMFCGGLRRIISQI
jgi:diacylglycerol kinase family enzyme